GRMTAGVQAIRSTALTLCEHDPEASRRMNRFPLLMPFLLLCWVGGTAMAQQTTVIQAENVRYAYAQVLRVTPVYQTLTATRTELRCEPEPASGEDSRVARVVGAMKGAVKDVLKRD